MDWAKSNERRDQMVLFPTRLDDVVAAEHRVRLLDDILQRLDWSRWELLYDRQRGQPPIHPRILAGVILYGLLNRIRSSRALEEALQVRLDFRWLVEGRSIDHTTLSEFRRKNADALKNTFVQIGFAPNDTPPATVDVESGLIVSADVIANTGEDSHMIAAIEDVQEQFALEPPPPEMLGDGLMATGGNLSECARRGIDLYSPVPLYSPVKGQSSAGNPALRDDPRPPPPIASGCRPSGSNATANSTDNSTNGPSFTTSRRIATGVPRASGCLTRGRRARRNATASANAAVTSRPRMTVRSARCWRCAFNLDRLFGLMRGGTGPPGVPT